VNGPLTAFTVGEHGQSSTYELGVLDPDVQAVWRGNDFGDAERIASGDVRISEVPQQ
jgi:hypothetical protein